MRSQNAYLLFGSIILLTLFLLAGCASRKPAQTESPAYKPYFPPNPEGTSQTQGDGTTLDPVGDCPKMSGERLQGELLLELNALREAGGDCMGSSMAPAPPLKWDPLLAQSASKHAEEMAIRGELTGLSANGSEVYQRLTLLGWSGGEVGENFHHGARSVEKVLQAWMLGSEYCQNLLNPNFTKVGAGYIDCYWYVIFAE